LAVEELTLPAQQSVDPEAQLNLLIADAVRLPKLQNDDAAKDVLKGILTGIVDRLRDLYPPVDERDAEARAERDIKTEAALGKILEVVAQEPSAGKAQMPLEIAPPLHQKLKAEAAANKRRGPGTASTMTAVAMVAIGEAETDGVLKQLVAKHKDGERHRMPLFGNIVMGTAPRGETMRMQFAPPTASKTVIDLLAAWYQVDFVVLVRLAVTHRYGRKKNAAVESKQS